MRLSCMRLLLFLLTVSVVISLLPSQALAAGEESCRFPSISGVVAGGPSTLSEVNRYGKTDALSEVLRRNPLICRSTSSSRNDVYSCTGTAVFQNQAVKVLNRYGEISSVLTTVALFDGEHAVVVAVNNRDIHCASSASETGQTALSNQPIDQIALEAKGYADREAFESWIMGLSGDKRLGAEFWAAERSKLKPNLCNEAHLAPESTLGCQDAQRRLSPFDSLRNAEPLYRKGWNAPLSSATLERVPPKLSKSFPQVSPELTVVRDVQTGSSAVGLSVTQIESSYPGVDCSSNICEFGNSRTPQIFCPSLGPCNKVSLYTDGIRVTGYVADFAEMDWNRSLGATLASYGMPDNKSILPSGPIKMKSEYWS